MMKSVIKATSFLATQAILAGSALASVQGGINAAQPQDSHNNSTVPTDLSGDVFGRVANILIFLVGALAVLVIIFGGLRYVTSTGDAARVKQAKDTILYGIIGLVIAILAYAIVTFVVGNLKPTP